MRGHKVLWSLKAGNSFCVYLDGGGGGAEENIYYCEIWFTENHRLKSTASYREGNNAFESLATHSWPPHHVQGPGSSFSSVKTVLFNSSWLQKKSTQLVQSKGGGKEETEVEGFLTDHQGAEPGMGVRTQDCCPFLWAPDLCFSEVVSFFLFHGFITHDYLGPSSTSLHNSSQIPVFLGLNSKCP